MTIHIGENTQNVQMLTASSIDLAAERAVSSPRPARYRDMGKLNQLIAEHELAVKEREVALDALEVAEIKQHELGGSCSKIRIGEGFVGQNPIIVRDCDESRSDGIKAIHEHYARMEKGHGFFGNMEHYLSRLAVQKAEALKRLHDACDKIDAAVKESGLGVAKAEINRTYESEDAAVTAILAYRAETTEECKRKGDYIRTTWWYGETKGDNEILDHHLEAMMQGMGCGMAS